MERLSRWRAPVRQGIPIGLSAVVVSWLAYVALGGVRGMERGAALPMGIFAVEIALFAYAGYRARRQGGDGLSAAVAGLAAGWTAALLADFPRSLLLMLNDAYMRLLQSTPGHHPGPLHMPAPPFTILAALVGALLAGGALGAACGSIGGSLARRPDRPAATQLP